MLYTTTNIISLCLKERSVDSLLLCLPSARSFGCLMQCDYAIKQYKLFDSKYSHSIIGRLAYSVRIAVNTARGGVENFSYRLLTANTPCPRKNYNTV